MANRTLDLRIPHQLTREQARIRVQEQFAKFETGEGPYGLGKVQHQWTGDEAAFQLAALGQQATGRIRLTDTAVELSIDLPWMLAALVDRIRPKVEAEARKALEYKP